MSSILEALKKLEEEKTARRGGTGNIAGKVTAASRRPGKRAVWLMPAGMAAVAIIAVLATYASMGGFSRKPAVTAPAKTDPISKTLAVSGPRAAKTDGSDGQAPPSDMQGAPRQPRSVTSPTATAVPGSPLPLPAPKHTSPPASSRQETPKGLAPSTQPPAAEQLPAISVTGIAWQQDNASRMAVLNDTTVTEGGIVAGARVVEIFPDRIRFSFKGKDFEVPLQK
jgi:general secretion pathway protein B